MRPRVEIVARAPAVTPMRCFCPECLRLDRDHPGEGYQVALFPYRAWRLDERRSRV